MRHKFTHRLRGVGDLISKSGANIRKIIIKALAIVIGSEDTRSPSMKLSGRPESPLELRISLNYWCILKKVRIVAGPTLFPKSLEFIPILCKFESIICGWVLKILLIKLGFHSARIRQCCGHPGLLGTIRSFYFGTCSNGEGIIIGQFIFIYKAGIGSVWTFSVGQLTSD